MASSAQPARRLAAELAFVVDRAPHLDDFKTAVIEGLARRQKTLPPKFFYDDAGWALFEAICTTPEYYPTRTELAILDTAGPEIARLAGPGAWVVEYGAGSSEKVRGVLEALDRPAGYVAIDILRNHVEAAARDIAETFPGIAAGAVCDDFTRAIALPAAVGGKSGRRLAFFPGSTIGNLEPAEAAAFLRGVRATVGAGGALLIGVDLVKDNAILNAAYNDSAGHTAAFNLNILHRIARELRAEVDVAGFTHHAFFNRGKSRIEMHLRSARDQSIVVDGQRFGFLAGETIHTESSYKYTLEGMRDLAGATGFEAAASWTDPQRLFSVHYLVAA